MVIIKRDGTKQEFSSEKIVNAILAAFKEVDGEITEYARQKAQNVAVYVAEKAQEKTLSVEEIQDLVEKGLMSTKRKDVAKAYVLYREKRRLIRNTTDKAVMELLGGDSEYWNTENSNKDATVVTTQRDYLAGITSVDIAKRYLLPEDVRQAHEQGIIHEHDMDYLAQMALHNCCLINLEDMLQNGTVINGVAINKPHRLLTAMTIATQIITAVASSQYGGCTISLAHLAPFVRDSKKYLENKYDFCEGLTTSQRKALIENDLKKEIADAVQTFNYQINSMSTTNG